MYTGAETGVDAVTHDLGYRVVMKLMQNVYADMSTPTTNSRRCNSTRISWLRIRTSYIIKCPEIVVLGVPRCIRMDHGTENGMMEDIQAALVCDNQSAPTRVSQQAGVGETEAR